MDNIQRFLESIEVKNTFKVANYVLKDAKDNIENYSLIELENFILDKKPNSPKAITTICYVLGLYAKWLDNDDMQHLIQSFDKKLLWKKSKPNVDKKFISHKQYKEIMHDIGVYEDYNSLYYQLLFQSVYEGIYSDDMSVVKNLKGSDVDNNVVTLYEDNGHSYKLRITEELAKGLKELSKVDIWERRNRYGLCKVEAKGLSSNTVFKIEYRNTDSIGTYRHSYYSRLRKISKEYVERTLTPLQLYVSGIMYRIEKELNKNGILLEEAFCDYGRNRKSYTIISNELVRCNYSGDVGNFKEMVKGHLDSFKKTE